MASKSRGNHAQWFKSHPAEHAFTAKPTRPATWTEDGTLAPGDPDGAPASSDVNVAPEEQLDASEINEQALQDTLRAMALRRSELAAHFYGRLFGRHPEFQPLFDGINFFSLQSNLWAVLHTAARSLHSPQKDDTSLHALGRFHAERQIQPEYFDAFREALIESLAFMTGPAWSEEAEQAWNAAIIVAASGVIEGIESAGDHGEPSP